MTADQPEDPLRLTTAEDAAVAASSYWRSAVVQYKDDLFGHLNAHDEFLYTLQMASTAAAVAQAHAALEQLNLLRALERAIRD
jgi:hypothetical protein